MIFGAEVPEKKSVEDNDGQLVKEKPSHLNTIEAKAVKKII